MASRLDPAFVRQEIERLRVTHPQIWDDGDEQLLLDMLEGETDFHRFLTAVARRIYEAEADAEGAAASVEYLISHSKARQQRFEARGEAMRSLAFKMLNWAGLRKLELPIATLSIRAGVPRVIVTDEARLPEHCIRIKREPNKVEIKQRLESGEQVPGAEMSNREDVLALRFT